MAGSVLQCTVLSLVFSALMYKVIADELTLFLAYTVPVTDTSVPYLTLKLHSKYIVGYVK